MVMIDLAFRLWFFLMLSIMLRSIFFFFSSRRRHTRCLSDWSSDMCSSDLFDRREIIEARVMRLPKQWSARFTAWNQLSDDFTPIKAVLENSDVKVIKGEKLEIGRASCRERGRSQGSAGPRKKEEKRRMCKH